MDLAMTSGAKQRDLLHPLPGESAFGALLTVAAARYEVMAGKTHHRAPAQLAAFCVVRPVIHKTRF